MEDTSFNVHNNKLIPFLFDFQDCKQVPYEHCENIHKQVPHQISWQKSVVVCGHNDGPRDNVEYEDDYDLFEKSDYDYDFYDDLGNIPVKRINTRDARIGIVQRNQTRTGRKLSNQNRPIKSLNIQQTQSFHQESKKNVQM